MATKRRSGLRKKGRIWHIEKVIPGYGRFRESTGETDYERAERYFDKRVEELREVSVYGQRPRVTLAEAAEKFLKEEWPAMVTRIHQLGLDVNKLLQHATEKEGDS